MTFEQLRIFVAVAERLHVTQAASHLNLTQSAVSASIAQLETQHGVRLFDRIGRRIELTEAGRLFLHEARELLARAAQTRHVLDELADELRGQIRIHASQTVASYWLPPHLLALRTAHPSIDIALTLANTTTVAAAVSDGSADIGFVEGAVRQDDLLQRVVARDELVLVVGREHPWSKVSAVEPSRYATQGWILREPGSGTRAEFEAHARGAAVAPEALRVLLELPSNEAVLSAVATGLGVSVLSRRAVASAVAAGEVAALPVDHPPRPFTVLTHPERHRTRAVAALLELASA
ncbi:LysR substrate-binding domain-containing protein [Aureimonas sp. AU4]|uniref:LysR substrate-binding domain-containing protein n=1 Tax=Aureimonas sp. AU4 TaxID=1638163 RepID=UPI000785CF86|nr:LysR substrate-binding domain-containing protein [Aureimonas sp. AU4]